MCGVWWDVGVEGGGDRRSIAIKGGRWPGLSVCSRSAALDHSCLHSPPPAPVLPHHSSSASKSYTHGPDCRHLIPNKCDMKSLCPSIPMIGRTMVI